MPIRRSPLLSISLALALASPVAALADSVTVVQKDKTFSQSEVRIKRGDTLVFSNADVVTHHVYSTSPGNAFEIKTQLPGRESAVPFPSAGTAEVRCAIHPLMKLTVTVDP